MDLKQYIKEKRPTLSEGSIKSYVSTLRSLYTRVFGGGEIDFEKYNETKTILEFLKDLEFNKRKSILSALVVMTENPEYRILMLQDIKSYNTDINKQEKTEQQENNWVTADEIKSVWKQLKKTADFLYKKESLNMLDLQNIQEFIIVSLLGGLYFAPRRSKDFTDFYIKDIDTEHHNYLEKNKMYFNSYKTAKFYGQQIAEIPKQLQNILKKWIAVNPTNTLLFDRNSNPLTAVKLNQRFNKIFAGKKISTNAFRHSYLTEKFGDQIQKNEEMDKTMEEMGSSNLQLKTYIKK
jgi:integrase